MRIFRWFADCRSMERRPRKDQVTLTWRDRHGEGCVSATCNDISNGGMGLETLEPVPLKAHLSVRMSDNTVVFAQVRHREQQGPIYKLGVEFTRKNPRLCDWKRREVDMAIEGMTW